MPNGKGLALPPKEQISKPVYEERHRVDKIGENFFVQSMFAAQNEAIDYSAKFRDKLESAFKTRVTNYANKLAKKVCMNSIDIDMHRPIVLEMNENNGLNDHSLVQFTATINSPKKKELN